MKTREEIKTMFQELPREYQHKLLEELLLEQELKGMVFQQAQESSTNGSIGRRLYI
jgi:hypothetical protein